ncbi:MULTISPECIES: hypothetical protein [unclassified Corynebacterium]|uniref:hypothetical protein n=1 Tax=unclassified Corynebacterium TaxID=2624378 RepID=UPI0029CA7EB3|nr:MULTISPECIES: hypothetical protein [unclassified Corynebacterium]WPF65573.1 hypothetical protein OLX12_08310 [Corynebacterium sp. 22KM0430]WPF68068.1 hypothetical protein OLW90_08300 [Corynebacterium sp. 21KM1197]
MKIMDNPWSNINFQDGVFISKSDGGVNLKDLWKGDAQLHLDLPPEPFIGNIDTAKLIVLLGNPGFSEADKDVFKCPVFHHEYEKCIHSGGYDGGFYYFTPETVNLPGGVWARRVYNQIMNAGSAKLFPGSASFDALKKGGQGKILDVMYESIMHIDFFPYHSKSSHNSIKGDGKCRDSRGSCRAGGIVPSQKWQFGLVGEAVKKVERGEAFIVVIRPREHWFCNVPSLGDKFGEMSNFIRYTPPQAISFTKGSLDFQNGKGTFDSIVDKLFP